MGTGSWIHWVVVLVIIVLVFGTSKLKNLGKDLGGAIKGFKEGMTDGGTQAASAAQQKVDEARKVASETIDVRAKEKS